MLELATQPGGTAPQAQVPGYRVAGKTGTARKIEGREYTHKYVASFVGIAPASNPRLIVAVMIDEPAGGDYYGGSVAGPVFSNVMGAALRMLDVPHRRAGRQRRAAAAGQRSAGGNVSAPGRQGASPHRGRRSDARLREERWPDAAAASLPTLRRRRAAARASPRSARHHRRQPARAAGRRLCRVSRARAATGARSSPTRSRAARPAVLWEARGFAWDQRWRVPNLAGSDLKRRRSARSPTAVHGHPSQALWMVGVTGTNGKTSCAHWIAQALRALRAARAAIVGTLGNGLRRRARAVGATRRPTRALLQRLLAQCAARRRAGGGDGGVVARARPGSRQRRRVRRRAVHQPDARPPRLPRHDGSVRRREGAPVRWPGLQRGRASTSTTPFGRSLDRPTCARAACA